MMFEMSNLKPEKTGLKFQVWYGAKVPKHNPFIKVDLEDNHQLIVRIDNHEVNGPIERISSRDLNDVFKWIDLNKDALLKYWNQAHDGMIDTVDMSQLLKPIS